MKMSLSQKQQLKLYMTTQLRQSIELLQYSHEDLIEFIREQALENPLIELQETTPTYKKSTATFDDVLPSVAGETDYRDELLRLLHCEIRDPRLLYACLTIVHNLDDNGYLSREAIAPYQMPEELLQAAITELQQHGPVGIGAFDLRHCLLLQLETMEPRHIIVEKIVAHHLEDVANGAHDTIAQALKISLPALRRAIRKIQTLEPKPCRSLFSRPATTITPDATVRLTDNGFTYQLNTAGMPKISLSTAYDAFFEHQEAADFLKMQFKRYEWLMNSLDQRYNTLTRLLEVVISHQQPFFYNGYIALKPLLLKDVAEVLGVHESTVSRAAKNKWIATPFGTIQLRSLFTNAVSEQGASQTSIKVHIQNLINTENKTRPLSDQKITDLLMAKENITLARRTVAKYRDELAIPSASKRKRLI